jgi:septum formation protein
MTTQAPPLILASGSPYRQALLARLGLAFRAIAPELDETALAGENAFDTSLRLARAKAESVARQHPGSLVIGSDQVACLHGKAIGKPGNHANALVQLQEMRAQTVAFHSALCLLDTRNSPPDVQIDVVTVQVLLRDLPDAELDAYLRIEQPYDCAGSAKNEGLGIALLEKIESTDPTALTGLPLITLTSMLRRAGILFFQGSPL